MRKHSSPPDSETEVRRDGEKRAYVADPDPDEDDYWEDDPDEQSEYYFEDVDDVR